MLLPRSRLPSCGLLSASLCSFPAFLHGRLWWTGSCITGAVYRGSVRVTGANRARRLCCVSMGRGCREGHVMTLWRLAQCSAIAAAVLV
jgi:hypothetical protein